MEKCRAARRIEQHIVVGPTDPAAQCSEEIGRRLIGLLPNILVLEIEEGEIVLDAEQQASELPVPADPPAGQARTAAETEIERRRKEAVALDIAIADEPADIEAVPVMRRHRRDVGCSRG